MYYELIVLGLVVIAVPYLAKLAGYKVGHKPFYLVGMSGVFFLLGAAISISVKMVGMLADLGAFLMQFVIIIGLTGLIIGSVWGLLQVIREPLITLTKS